MNLLFFKHLCIEGLLMIDPVVRGLAIKIKCHLDSGEEDFWVYGNIQESLLVDGISCTRDELEQAFESMNTKVCFTTLTATEVISRQAVFDNLPGGISEVVSVKLA